MSAGPTVTPASALHRLARPSVQAFGRIGGALFLGVVAAVFWAGGAVTSAAFTDKATNPVSTFAAAASFGGTVTSTAIGNGVGCASGRIKQGGSYYIYANVSGSAPSVTANVGTITTGQTSVPLTAGSYSSGGATYNYRSAALTANATVAEGARSYTVTANTGATGSVTVDNTAPTGVDFQAVNKTGGIAGRPEQGDVITYTFSEPMDTCSFLPTWTGTTANVAVVILNNGSSNDALSIWDEATVAQLPFGDVDLNGDNVSANSWWLNSTAVASGNTVTITLGTPGDEFTKADNKTNPMVWTPSAAAYDRAANAGSIAAASEAAPADVNF
jgi:hypothetical protein